MENLPARLRARRDEDCVKAAGVIEYLTNENDRQYARIAVLEAENGWLREWCNQIKLNSTDHSHAILMADAALEGRSPAAMEE